MSIASRLRDKREKHLSTSTDRGSARFDSSRSDGQQRRSGFGRLPAIAGRCVLLESKQQRVADIEIDVRSIIEFPEYLFRSSLRGRVSHLLRATTHGKTVSVFVDPSLNVTVVTTFVTTFPAGGVGLGPGPVTLRRVQKSDANPELVR